MTGDEVYGALSGEIDDVKNLINQKIPEDVYGFIEHMAIKDPASRIEYIGKNKNYSPISIDLTAHTYDLGDWANFNFLVQNKPYMVKADGTADYELSETDYNYKKDGKTASDVANASYAGGAFAWIPRIYKKEYVTGTDRYVLFSDSEKDGFYPNGFVDGDNKVLKGVWIPMFYSTNATKATSIAGNKVVNGSQTTDAQKKAVDAFSARARFLGGAILDTLADIEILLSKTSNIQAFYGYGNCGGYNASDTTRYGTLDNAVVGGGQFYGSDDEKSLNKMFHSIVLGSYDVWLRNPYEIVVAGKVKVSPNYNYDVTGASYEDTGLFYDGSINGLRYPCIYQPHKRYGSLPLAWKDPEGSTETGTCDGLWLHRWQTSYTMLCFRLGGANAGHDGGARTRTWTTEAGFTYWDSGFALLLLPPAGEA